MPPSKGAHFSSFRFAVAPLPRPVYNALRDFLTRHQGVSMWEAVVAAVLLTLETERQDPAKLEETLDKVRSSY